LKQVRVLADAAEDLEAARDFYDTQEPGVGEYCVDSLLADIESLGLFSGMLPGETPISRRPSKLNLADAATSDRGIAQTRDQELAIRSQAQSPGAA